MEPDQTASILRDIERLLAGYQEEGLSPGLLVQHMMKKGFERNDVAAAVRRGIDHKTLTLGERFSIRLDVA